ncbi:MAG: SAM-dependent methyltransferase [Proteobacteria bacterium]|nr:SAM-dependent methyltransferase [Pseudomonadota bacterium]
MDRRPYSAAGAISNWPDFKSAVTLHLVETSPRLRQLQAETLKKYAPAWHDHIRDIPDGISFIIANEFFDALPIHQFEKVDGMWRERCVGYDEKKDSFHFTTVTQDEAVVLAGEGSDGDIFEVSPATLNIVEDMAHRIAQQGGAALIIDYGHTAPAFGDTVQAVTHHQYSNPLEEPGEKDITAHIDFGTCKAVAEQSVAVAGPVTQGQFLITLGIEARAQMLCEKADNQQCRKIMTDLCRLVAPQEMGRMFKVMALTPKEAIIELAGFPPAGV